MSPPNVTPAEAVQSADVHVVQLYDLDLTPVSAGAPVLHMVSDAIVDELTGGQGQPVSWGDVDYWPVPMLAEGFDRTNQGAPPQPTWKVGDVGKLIRPWVFAGQDLLGAELTRTVTLRRYLDGFEDPDGSAFILRDTYILEQKLSQTPGEISWRLVSSVDQGERQIPGRQVIRDACQLRYRVWTGTAWDYTKATCPYNGAALFKVDGTTTVNESEDLCSRRLGTGCRKRFVGVPLPTSAFPGVGSRR